MRDVAVLMPHVRQRIGAERGGLAGGRVARPERSMVAPHREEAPGQRQRARERLVEAFRPAQPAGLERGVGLRAGDPIHGARLRELGERGELTPPSVDDRARERGLEIREERERRTRGPLLAHEQQRRHRRGEQ
jgi:hypothetical protein